MGARRSRLLGFVAFVLVLALTAVACGGGDSDDGEAGRTEAPDLDVEATARAALEHFDDDAVGAGLAILQATDRGYTVEQFAAALEEGTLDPHGFVVVDGEVADPDGEPTDVITGKAEAPTGGQALVLVASVLPAQDGDTYDLDTIVSDGLEGFLNRIADARQQAREEAAAEARRRDELSGRYMLMFLLDLVRLGVPLENAIEMILEPLDLTDCFADDYSLGCVDLADVEESANDSADDSAGSDEEPAAGATDGAWSLSYTIALPDTGDDAEFSITGDGSFDVAEDGTVSGSASLRIVSSGTCRIEATGEVEDYRFAGSGSYSIEGTRSGDELDLTLTPTGGVDEREGNEGALCVEVAGDVTEAFFTDAATLPVTVPASDGAHSTEIDLGDGFVVTFETTIDAPGDGRPAAAPRPPVPVHGGA